VLIKLAEFLLDLASENEEIKQRIELDFEDGNDEGELYKSIALIRTIIRNNSDKHGFSAYGDAYEAVKGADLVLEKARIASDQNKTVHALQLSLCVIHEMMDLLQGADDSDGVIGGVIEESFAFIEEIYTAFLQYIEQSAASNYYANRPAFRDELSKV